MKKFSVLLLILSFMVIVSAYPFSFTDDSGRLIVVEKPFERVVSLYGAHSENIYYLNGYDFLIGVSESEAFPSRLKNIQSFSYKDDVEKFIFVDPDLVIIRPMIFNRYNDLVKKLEAFGIMVVSLQPENYDDINDYWKKLGILIGKIDEADELIEEYEKKINSLPLVKEQDFTKIFFESVHRNFRTTNKGSIADFVLRRSGLFNVADEAEQISMGSTIAEFSREQLIDKGEEIEYYISQKGAMNKIDKETIKKSPGFNAIKAVRNDEIIIIDEKIISRPTPRIYYAVVEMYKLTHNDYFTKNYELYNDEKITNMSFSRIIIDFLKIQFKTPEYFEDEMMKNGHLFGDFEDINYRKIEHLYAETAFYNEIVITEKNNFNPDRIMTSKDVSKNLERILNMKVDSNFDSNKQLIDFLKEYKGD